MDPTPVIINSNCASAGAHALFAPLTISGLPFKLLVDSGAAVTILSHSAFSRLPARTQRSLEPASINLQTASGQQINCYGRFQTKLQLEQQTLPWKLVIADVDGDGCLGLDFLHTYDYCLSAAEGLKLQGRRVKTESRSTPPRICKIQVAHSAVIPAGGSALLTGKLPRPSPDLTGPVLLEPAPHVQSTYLLQVPDTCFNAGQQRGVPLLVFNSSATDVSVHKGAHLANASPIDGEPEPVTIKRSTARVNACQRTELQQDNRNHAGTNRHDRVYVLELERKLKTLAFETARTAGLSGAEERQLTELLLEHKEVFSANATDLGRTKILKHQIDTGDARPIRIPPRRAPKAFQPHEDQLIDQLLEAGVIKPSNSPWSQPAVFCKKQSGEWRLCFDARALNKITKRDSFPLPRISECLDGLEGSRFYSALDLNQAYFQVELEEESKEKASFSTTKGHWSYEVLPMGLANSVATFCRLIAEVFRGILFKDVIAYLDDILVPSVSFQQGIERLDVVFRRLKAANLKLKPEKCKLLQREAKFLGFILSEEGIKTDPAKVEAIVNWPTPRTVTDIRAFLGLTGFYRKWIRGYAEIASPMTKLLEKHSTFHWSPDCEAAFQTLKEMMVSSGILAFPKDEDMFILDTDASGHGIGAVLSQKQWSEHTQSYVERPVAYASKTLSKAERRYCVTRRELLAVVVFTNQFKHYLLGKQFLLRTDHSSLRWIFSFKDPRNQLARWLEILSQYDFKIEHRRGKSHSNADAMSRRLPAEDCTNYDRGVRLQDLPCGGCPHCMRHHEEWEAFYRMDDIVPLTAHTENRPPTAPQETHSGGQPKASAITAQQKCGLETVAALETTPSADDMRHDPTWGWRDGFEFTRETLIREQEQDSNLAKCIRWLQDGVRPAREDMTAEGAELRNYWLNFDLLCLVGGVLCRRWLNPANTRSEYKIAVPQSLRKEVLKKVHDDRSAGHFGIDTTRERVLQHFYWYNLRRDVEMWVKSCQTCQLRKKGPKRTRAPLAPFLVNTPMEEICIDIAGPFPVSDRGNRYILAVICKFTRFAECYAIPETSAATVAEVLVSQFMSRYGIPWNILSDQGTNFESALFKEVCHLLDIKKKRTSGYHPQCNGLVENLNKSVIRMISAYIDTNQRNWCEHLPWIMAAYRSHKHPSTGFTPNFLMFGRECNLPAHLAFGTASPVSTEVSPAEYVQQLDEKLCSAYALARKHLRTACERNKRDYDLKATLNSYKVGDVVLCLDSTRKTGVSKKLNPHHWKGPCVITAKLSDLLFEVQPRDKRKKKIIHHDRLKLYLLREPLPWITNLRRTLLQPLEEPPPGEGVAADTSATPSPEPALQRLSPRPRPQPQATPPSTTTRKRLPASRHQPPRSETRQQPTPPLTPPRSSESAQTLGRPRRNIRPPRRYPE